MENVAVSTIILYFNLLELLQFLVATAVVIQLGCFSPQEITVSKNEMQTAK